MYPAPDSETWKPKAGFAMTLIQGAGVHCPSPRTVTYSRPSSTKPPRPLKNSNSGRGGGTVTGESAPGAAGRRGDEVTLPGVGLARASCSASVPWRLRRTVRATACRASRSFAERRSRRRMKTVPWVSCWSCRSADWLVRTSASKAVWSSSI